MVVTLAGSGSRVSREGPPTLGALLDLSPQRRILILHDLCRRLPSQLLSSNFSQMVPK